ncbi:saccharopine dehydrogenase family protein [Alteromonas antoniana]|uniref:saccharopine dehydrogenase family protein n=1 Tax=Alteromonas antoniana TaxID=2803813 RepID=UPI001C458B22|nr:saccharopine dehydrogenase NADP-binding domain-containing protein [Alteromonas antoniana]
MTEKRKYDIILFGATSFVGQIITGYLANRLDASCWAVAGRNEEKLRTVLAQHGCTDTDMMVVDANDDKALHDMCQQASVIITTVGPYALYGESVVAACAETGTGYVDLTGEPQWIKKMQDKYQETAKQHGAQIVHCCGFDSIPSDMGVYFLQQHAQQKFQSAFSTVAMRVHRIRGGASGGTVASMLNLVEEAGKDKAIKKQLSNPYLLCGENDASVRQPNVKKACYDPVTGAWIAPFIMAAINTRVVHWSNCAMAYPYGKSFRYEEAMVTGRKRKGAIRAWTMTLGLGGFMVAASVSWLRTLLEKYWLPKPGEGPSEKAQQQGFYDIRFYGETSDGKRAAARVTGDRDPGYGSTAKMLSECAILLVSMRDEGTAPSGQFSPASCFGDALIPQLSEHAGLRFEIV